MQTPEPPLMIQDVDQEDVELKKRTAKEWKRWASARGPASARFRQVVRNAYSATCIVCGAHYPATPFNLRPGVDAAHILPWSEYDLDEAFNGLCLCKLHHWAFDEFLIRIYYDGSRYISEMPEESESGILAFDPAFSIAALKQPLGIIPTERLPVDRAQWPRPELLETLEELR